MATRGLLVRLWLALTGTSYTEPHYDHGGHCGQPGPLSGPPSPLPRRTHPPAA